MFASLDENELQQLIASRGGPHLSVFLPAPQRPIESHLDATKLANTLRPEQQRLVDCWMPTAEAQALISPLVELCHDSEFLAHRRHSVAIFRSAELFKTYAIDHPLDQASSIGRAFRICPVVPQIRRSSFYVLTLSQNKVAMLMGAGSELNEVTVPGFPESFSFETANVTADRGSQVHSSGRAAFGKQAGVFHGQGGHDDARKSELTEYLHRVDDAVVSYLQERSGQLILAGVDSLTSQFRAVSDCPRLCETTISGNVDRMSFVDIHEKASTVLAEEEDRQRQIDAAKIREQREHPVATDPEQILSAAHEGRIDTLFFDRSAELFGNFYADTKTMKETRQKPSGDPSDANFDLIEIAVAQTFLHNGAVHSVARADMPIDVKMAASLRY